MAHKILLATLLLVGITLLTNGRVHAATLSVAGGCTIGIAIDSVNAGANQPGCTASGAYGSSDQISIPAGTHTLTADLPTITEPVSVVGAGMGQTTISGDNGQFDTFSVDAAGSFEISGMRITAFDDRGIFTDNTNVTISAIEIDGNNIPGASGLRGIDINFDAAGIYTVDAEDVYIHDLEEAAGNYIFGFAVSSREGTTVDVDMQNTTLADIYNDGDGINGIIMFAGQGNGTGGVLTASIVNTTVDNVVSTGLTAPFAGFASEVTGATVNPSVTMTIDNITITGTRGEPGSGFTAGLESAAFYAAGLSASPGEEVNVDITVSNSLMADNLSNGVSYNCSHGDLSPNIGGLGTVNTSITSAGYNLADDASCAGFNQTGDEQNLNNITSTLGTLQDNGGDVPTRALLAGSPAIGAGSAVLGVSTDARGVNRTASQWDVGAYQTVLGDSTGGNSSGNGSGGSLANSGQNILATFFAVVLIFATALTAFLSKRHVTRVRG